MLSRLRIAVALLVGLTLLAGETALAADPRSSRDDPPSLEPYLTTPLAQEPALMLVPRSPVPPRLHDFYRKMRNPVADTADSLAKGRLLFVANCKVCHGSGRGGAAEGRGFTPEPADLTNPALQMARQDGELFYVIKNGSKNTAMLPWGGRLSDRDVWMLVRYLRHLSRQP